MDGYEKLKKQLTKGITDKMYTQAVNGLIDTYKAQGLSPDEALDKFSETFNELAKKNRR